MKLYNTLALSQHNNLNLYNLESPSGSKKASKPFKSNDPSFSNSLSSGQSLGSLKDAKLGGEDLKLSFLSTTQPSTLIHQNKTGSEEKEVQKDEDDHCYLLNRKFSTQGYNLKPMPSYKDVSMTTVIPHKTLKKMNTSEFSTSPQSKALNKKILRAKVKKQRKELREIQNQTGSKRLYLSKMKKMVKMVSTIIYYHILHSHGQSSRPSKLANQFNQKKIFEDLNTKKSLYVNSFPCMSSSIVTHLEKEVPKVKVDTEFNRGMIYEFLEVVFGCLSLHLECVLISLVYLETLMTKKGCEIRMSNWRPLLLTCVILACKYWEEGGYWNSDFSEVTGFPTEVINTLESKAVGLLEYKLFISSHLYSQYYMEVRALYKKVKKEEERNYMKKQYKKYGVVGKKAKSGLINN